MYIYCRWFYTWIRINCKSSRKCIWNLKLANVFSDRLNQVNIKVSPKENLIEINSSNQDVGENNITIKSQIIGEEVVMSFNVKYLLDCFQSINSDQITLKFNGNQKPIAVGGVGLTNFIYLVMPVRR